MAGKGVAVRVAERVARSASHHDVTPKVGWTVFNRKKCDRTAGSSDSST